MVRTKTTPTHSTAVKAVGTLNDAPSTYQDIPRNEPENGTVRNQRADAAASTDANERSLFVGRYCGAHSHPLPVQVIPCKWNAFNRPAASHLGTIQIPLKSIYYDHLMSPSASSMSRSADKPTHLYLMYCSECAVVKLQTAIVPSRRCARRRTPLALFECKIDVESGDESSGHSVTDHNILTLLNNLALSRKYFALKLSSTLKLNTESQPLPSTSQWTPSDSVCSTSAPSSFSNGSSNGPPLGALELQICLSASVLNDLSAVPSAAYVNINNVMAWFFPDHVERLAADEIDEECTMKTKEDCDGFLRLLSKRRPEVSNWKLKTDSIVPILRPYQVDAVRFMISRELHAQLDYSNEEFFLRIPADPPFYYSRFTGTVFDVDCLPTEPPFHVPPGGILADEMGLGKTVELLALIMTHQRNDPEAPQMDPRPQQERTCVECVLDEVVSAVVAGIDGALPLQKSRTAWKARKRSFGRTYYFNQIDDFFDASSRALQPKSKKRKLSKARGCLRLNRLNNGSNTENVPLTIACELCAIECSRRKVFWDRFESKNVLFKCPNCLQKQQVKKQIGTTLVLAPSTICHQWYEEVKRHVRETVQVDLYEGVAKEGYKHPEYLATRHIVICSFETLANEVHFVETNRKSESLRRPCKYLITPTPLLAVEWWRICVDEAQVIEGNSLGQSNTVTEMCWKLNAVNRWCVTGTPITNTVQNLYGLLCFIGLEPYCYQNWWYGALWRPYETGLTEPLLRLFSKILWRNTKDDVIDQISPPTRASEVTVLHFSPLEQQLYRETLTSRLNRLPPALVTRAAATDIDEMPINQLHGKLFDAIMEPLQAIRTFIVHPGLRFSRAKQNVTSEHSMMEELFRITTHQIEEKQRSILLYCNSIAGIDLLLGDQKSAARSYENALAAVRLLENVNEQLSLTNHRGAFRKLQSDKLQVIHTMNSVIELLNEGVQVSGIDVRNAREKLKDTENGYTKQAVLNVRVAHEAIEKLQSEYEDIEEQMSDSVSWINEALSIAEQNATLRFVFSETLRNALDANNRSDFPVHQLLGASFVCVQRWDELVDSIKTTFTHMTNILRLDLLAESSIESLETIAACHYKQVEAAKNCPLCLFNKQLNQLESLLFVGAPSKKKPQQQQKQPSENGKEEEEEEVEGTAGAKKISTLEIVIHSIRSLLQRYALEYFSMNLLKCVKETESLIEMFKKLLQLGKDLYAASEEFAARTDELRQCKLRLEYATELTIQEYGGSVKDLPNNFVISGSEGDMRQTHRQALEAEKFLQTRLLSKLRYVASLTRDNAKRPDCPICLSPLGQNWLVFPCVHCLCTCCFAQLSKHSKSVCSLLRCPVCRAAATRGSIAFVQNRSSSQTLHFLDSPRVTVKGNVSVKLDAVIRRLLSIHERDPWSKTLVFTSLNSVIPIVCELLAENEIPFRNFTHSKRQQILAEFRLDPNIQVLIIPISQGARGLNLTVANNIIFVEPQLNASQLAQAIGRIDRIGQTRQMMIHHFVVYGSVEEHIHHRITNPKCTEWTVAGLRKLLYTGAEYFDQAINQEQTQSNSDNVSQSIEENLH